MLSLNPVVNAEKTLNFIVQNETNDPIMVYLLTPTQKDLLVGQEYTPGAIFWPVQDCNGTWLITQEEIDQLTNEEFAWIRELVASEYCPPEEGQ